MSATDTTAGNGTEQPKSGFQILDEVLKSDDLAAVIRAFSALQQAVQNAWIASGNQPDANHPVIRDFDAMADSLNGGYLAATRNAFARLKQDVDAIAEARLREAA